MKYAYTFIACIILTACGGSGGGSDDSSPAAPKPSLVSIAITSNQVFIGRNRQFTAMGLFSDNTQTDITHSLLWTSDTPSVATVSSGLVAGVATGTALITAASGTVSKSVLLNITYPWTHIAAGGGFSVGLKSDGSLWTWGDNTYGALGESRTVTNIPVRLGTDTWVAIATGSRHVLAIKSDGSLWAWGDNAHGQCGNAVSGGTVTAPVQVGTYSKNTGNGTYYWISVGAGDSHSLAVLSDTALYTWGNNGWGQLGDQTKTDRSSPVKITTAIDSSGWASIAGGDYHSCGAKAGANGGTLWAWGDNYYGELGNTTSALTYTAGPTIVSSPSVTGWVEVKAAATYCFARHSSGEVLAWGGNDGQFGNGTTALAVTTPITIATSVQSTPGSIAAGTRHAFYIRSDGALFTSGNNQWGQLGISSTITYTLNFTRVGSDTSWSSVAAGTTHSLALKTDGTLWAWGANSLGQLGDGGAESIARTPVLIYY